MKKIFLIPLIFIMTISCALYFFAPSPTFSVNKSYKYKAVKFCCTQPVAQIIRARLDSLGAKQFVVRCFCERDTNTFDSNNEKFALAQTQEEIEKRLHESIKQMKEFINQQKITLKTGSPENLDVFMKVYKEFRSGIQNANSIALASNYGDEFNKHFPNFTGFKNMSETEWEIAQNWRELIDAWLKSLNVAARNFDEEQRIRDSLMNNVLRTYADTIEYGQTYLLQYAGASAIQGDALIDRTSAEWCGFAEICGTSQQLSRSHEEAVKKNISVIAGEASRAVSNSKEYTLGF